MPNQANERLVYESARAAMVKAGISANHAVLTQSFLRLEAALTTTNTSYKFDVLVNEQVNTNFNTQTKLNLQDAFLVASIGLFVTKPSSSSDTTSQLVTYPNASIFSSSNTATSLFTIYNGKLTLSRNQRELVTGWDCYRHYAVPQQQQTANADYTSSGIAYKDQQSGADSGFYPCEPNWILDGGKKNDLSLVLPSSLAAVETNSRVVLILRGILAQNSTSIN